MSTIVRASEAGPGRLWHRSSALHLSFCAAGSPALRFQKTCSQLRQPEPARPGLVQRSSPLREEKPADTGPSVVSRPLLRPLLCGHKPLPRPRIPLPETAATSCQCGLGSGHGNATHHRTPLTTLGHPDDRSQPSQTTPIAAIPLSPGAAPRSRPITPVEAPLLRMSACFSVNCPRPG